MFPYVCLATMPLFCNESWPRKVTELFTTSDTESDSGKPYNYTSDKKEEVCAVFPAKIKWRHRFVTIMLLLHCCLQMFLPYSHFVTKVSNEI